MILFLIPLELFLIYKLYCYFFNDPCRKKGIDISIFFGAPGSGKTTLGARYAEQAERTHTLIYGNIDLDYPNYIKIDSTDLGRYDFHDCTILCDESGVDFNNRDYKNFSKDLIKYLKYHRHFNAKIVFFSQSYEDMDITIRRLAQRYYLVKKSFLFKLNKKIVVKRIKKSIVIQKETRQIIDAYDFVFLSKFVFSGRRYFKHFDTHYRYPLPSFEGSEETFNKSVLNLK